MKYDLRDLKAKWEQCHADLCHAISLQDKEGEKIGYEILRDLNWLIEQAEAEDAMIQSIRI